MRTFNIHPFAAAIICSTLLMGVMGVFIVFPIACIHWLWNAVAVHVSATLPPIAVWQASLLYVAGALLLYISGIIQIEFKAESIDR